MAGTLFVVATPIGNLQDLSPRALEVLRSVDWIACEDTRHTARLLARFEIEARTLSLHRFNETERCRLILDRLREGASIALVSDAGTPAISDPGATVVAAVVREGIPVTPLPGPSAPIALLSASGLPADRFVFDGFLPHRAGERRTRLRELRAETRTLVVLEAARRVRATLSDLDALFGARAVVLGRELTKLHETIVRGSAREILAQLPAGEVKGEIVLAIAGASPDDAASTEAGAERVVEVWRRALDAAGGNARSALRSAARELETSRPALWRLLAELGALDGPRR